MQFLGLNVAQWNQIGISALVILAALVLGRWVIRGLLIPLLRRFTRRTSGTLDDSVLDAIQYPAYWLLLLVSFEYALGRLDFIKSLAVLPLDDVSFILYALVFFIMAWRLVSGLFEWFMHEQAVRTDTDLDQQLLPFFSRISLIIVALIAIIIVLGHFNVEVSGLVATLGIGSLAIALAAQEALADTISGFLIMIDRPFRIGDRVELLDLDTWGDVVDIGLRSTRIRTLDNRMVIVPNSTIAKSLIVNHSYPDDTYRLQIELGLAYGTDIEKARQVLIEAVSGVEGVLATQAVEALFLQFGDSALIFRVRWWLDSYVDTRRMFDKVNTAMYQALNEAGIEIPFPQQAVHHRMSADQQSALAAWLKQGQ